MKTFVRIPDRPYAYLNGFAAGLVALVLALCVGLPPAQAFTFDTGNTNLTVRWDNTLKYSTAYRLSDPSGGLIANPNLDDGDRDFDSGFISNRVDLLSELDVVFKRSFGVRVSGAAWYDTIYNSSNDNDSPSTVNAFSVPYNEFTDDTQELHGKKAELLDAFAFGRTEIGSTGLSVRVGQFAMLWGESLFFGNNGIAGGMSPIDVIKLQSVPDTQFKELIRPVPQVSAQLQLSPTFSIAAYYQVGWEETRLPGVGSYFSTQDQVDIGGERLFAGAPLIPGGGPAAFYRGDDMDARDTGQGGIQLRMRVGEYDFGLYAIQYHDKVPQLYIEPSVVDTPGGPLVLDPNHFNPLTGQIGQYYLVYPEYIRAYGASATTTFGIVNLAGEVSMRRNTPLVSDPQIVIPGTQADNDIHALYAVGNSMHAQVSTIVSFGPSFISQEAMLLGEVAWNRLTSIEKNPQALDPNTSRDGLGMRFVYEPYYRQVFPGVDFSVPVGFSYFPKGASAVVSGFGPDQGGDINIGMTASYLDVWRFRLNYTHYYGESAPYLDDNQHLTFKQSLADRDFISFSVYRTF